MTSRKKHKASLREFSSKRISDKTGLTPTALFVFHISNMFNCIKPIKQHEHKSIKQTHSHKVYGVIHITI